MRQLQYAEVQNISGGTVDWKMVASAVGGGLVGAGYQWFKGADWLSSQALIWGAGGAALGTLGFYAVQTATDYLSGE